MGLAFIPLLGIEADEALFAQALYQPRTEAYSILIGKTRVPIMVMTYVGAVKAWIYGPLLRNLGVTLYTLRVPMLLAGSISIWFFFLLLRRVAGYRAALIGCAFLAVDALYLLTATFDWGPVALQHLFMLGGALALVRFFQEYRTGSLAGAAFLFGLAMSDKALAIWTLSGLAVGGLLTFPREILRAVTLKRIAVAVVAFALGALPLIWYNAAQNWGTFRGNFERNTDDLPGKADFVVRTMNGEGLFAWMMFEDWQTARPHPPANPVQKAAARISALAGAPKRSLFVYAFLLALLLAPLGGWKSRRMILMALIAFVVAWIQMAINRDTGGSIHHTILLWPLPQFIVAVSFAAASRRLGRAGLPAIAGISAVGIISSALVLNEYFVQSFRNGGAPFWTDAIYSLSRYLKNQPVSWVIALDWSISEQIRLLHRGRILAGSGTDEVSRDPMTPQDHAAASRMLGIRDAVFVAHTPAFEIIKGGKDKLTAYAAGIGYRRETVAVIPDSYGRDVYEVYRFVK